MEARLTKFLTSLFIFDTYSLATVNSSSTLDSAPSEGSGFFSSFFETTDPTSPKKNRKIVTKMTQFFFREIENYLNLLAKISTFRLFFFVDEWHSL